MASDNRLDDASHVVRLRLDLRYDGTDFVGWALQPGLRSVQGVLEQALDTVLRVDCHTTVAGRTDTGVHARGQVAHVDIPQDTWDSLADDQRSSGTVLMMRLASLLPSDLVVNNVALAPEGFDARFSALSRRYCYRIADALTDSDPLERGYTLPISYELDVEAMNTAAHMLIGEHDFAAFCRPREGATTIRTLQEFSWTRVEPSNRIEATVIADAFCHHMVRALVGACIDVGRAKRSPQWPKDVLDAGVRDSSVTVVPALGLVLEEVVYPSDDQLQERAAITRHRRS